tara:strand:- start:573 stop:800 length:228 start_codon:yes stop_codon:yes gene_type:complete
LFLSAAGDHITIPELLTNAITTLVAPPVFLKLTGHRVVSVESLLNFVVDRPNKSAPVSIHSDICPLSPISSDVSG